MSQENEYCQFCDILSQKKENDLVIAEDENFFAFHDLNKGTSQAHVLACTKQHIESALHVKDANILDSLQKFGEKVLTMLYGKKYKKQPKKEDFRFGFHLPPHISIFHIHLHCFILPIQNKLLDQSIFGFGLKSAKTIKERLQTNKKSKL